MTNIERYPGTKDAIEAWRQSVEVGVFLSFDEWAQREYEALRVPTLLEAAEAVRDTWCANMQHGSLSRVATAISKLSGAITIEKTKPVRNCDKYRTAEEAAADFVAMCKGIGRCEHCRFHRNPAGCSIAWLYAEARKEVK